jgi:hypothetical protein
VLLKERESFTITLVEPVSPELLHLAVGDLLSFFHLSGVQLHLSRINCAPSCRDYNVIIFVFIWIAITILIIVDLLLNMVLIISSSSVLLSNPAL